MIVSGRYQPEIGIHAHCRSTTLTPQDLIHNHYGPLAPTEGQMWGERSREQREGCLHPPPFSSRTYAHLAPTSDEQPKWRASCKKQLRSHMCCTHDGRRMKPLHLGCPLETATSAHTPQSWREEDFLPSSFEEWVAVTSNGQLKWMAVP